ncbi:MAG: hypothetical protein KKG54_07505 [Alphaproteobacteria bacterium]|nr:hypothetical protein [Alphaproteobacteria bacterium]
MVLIERPLEMGEMTLIVAPLALLITVMVSKFDEMVADGRMPAPRVIDTRKVWDRLEVDQYFAALPADMASNPWDGIAA